MSATLTPLDRRVALTLFVVTAIAAGYFFSGGGWNQNSHFDLTRAIVERQTIVIDAYRSNTGDYAIRDGHAYSNKAPGASFFAVPVYALVHAIERMAGADVNNPFVATLNAWIATFFVSGLSGALIAPLLFLYARRVAQRSMRTSMIIAALVFFATPLFAYSTLFYLHVVSGMLMLLALLLVPAERPRTLFLAGLAAGAATLANYLSIVLPAALLVQLLVQRRARAAAWFVAGTLPAAILLAWYQIAAFGAIFRNPVAMNARFAAHDGALGVLTGPSLGAFVGITISPYRGFFYVAPILLIAFAGIAPMIRARRAERAPLFLTTALFFLFNVSFNNWEGGFGIGARYLVPIIPLLGMLMAWTPMKYRSVIAVLAFVSLAHNFSATAVDPQPSGSIARPLEEYVYPLLFNGRYPAETLNRPPWTPALYDGHTSVNRETVLEALPFQRFRPGTAEAEWASFNAGEFLFGAGTAASLIPIALFLIGSTVFLFRMTRERDA